MEENNIEIRSNKLRVRNSLRKHIRVLHGTHIDGGGGGRGYNIRGRNRIFNPTMQIPNTLPEYEKICATKGGHTCWREILTQK